MSSRVVHGLPVFVVLLGTWLLLQGEMTVGNVVGGALLALLLVVLFPVGSGSQGSSHRVHPVALLRFLSFVLVSLVRSSWAVIVVIVRPTPENLRSGVVRVRLTEESGLTATIVANAITLTPGTMTLTARLHPAELHVHVMGLGDLEEFRESVYDLERRVLAAMTPVQNPVIDEEARP